MPLELELQRVNEALENDGGDGINHSHIPTTPAKSNLSNSNSLDTESVPRESRIRQQPKLPTGFEYTAWLTTAFLSGYEAGVQDPSTYHEAMTGINAKEWKLGCDDEFHSLDINNTWKLVPRPRDQTVLGAKWVFKAKRDLEGRITRYKTRWVVQGFRQQHGVNFDETYASVVKSNSYKVLLAIATFFGWPVDHMDFITAFLHGAIGDHIVYVEQSLGYEIGVNLVCQLQKALYELKQSVPSSP
ncbi:reverse transcriptase domain-containing protein [uncultured Nostoc sp.]|uniref:reverse transcriptase domain-containing protein n=1 Tax=uncultured Nostoc sp. TaxID=340711 RepID=UPI0035CA92B7